MLDLFGLLPSKKHIVVIQDLASRYPVAEVVGFTNVKSVIPVLKDIYNTFSNPQHKKSDNNPPFNSNVMLILLLNMISNKSKYCRTTYLQIMKGQW